MKIDDTQKIRSFRFPTVGILALVLILALCFRLPQPLHAAQFKATAVHMINGRQTGVEQIYVSGDWVRIETPMGKGAKVTLLRPDRQVMVEIDTRDRSYKEMPGVPGASWANFYQALQKALTQTGEEAVAGQTCQRLEAPGGVASFWFSKELDFPIRTVMSGETIELHNIVVEEIDPKIFEPPAGYRLAFSIFAMQNGQPKFKPEDIAGVATPSLSADASSGKNRSLSKSNPPSILPEPDEPLPDPLLRIRTVPSNGGRLSDPEEPLAVLFSRPVLADHFSFTLSPDPGGWQALWNGDATKVLLHHEKPFASGQTYILTASMIGEADISASFTVHALDGALRLDRDLSRGAISIDQVARVRLNQIFNPSAVSDQYRRQNPGPSGTWNMLQIARSLDDLTPETKREITPYFLPPANPGSVYYDLFHSSGSRKSGQSAFNFVAKAWADDDRVKAVYKTGTGYEVIVWGDRRMKNVVYKARDLIKQYNSTLSH